QTATGQPERGATKVLPGSAGALLCIDFPRTALREAGEGGRRSAAQAAGWGNARADRDNQFVSQGFRVSRFWNHEIDRNLDGMLTLINNALSKPPPGRASLGHPPPSGEG